MKDGKFGEMVLDLVKAVWKDKGMPQEWADANPYSYPQQGELVLL